ncbi:hypothetical protein KJA14_02645 [Patescibacteria group bacterium]|nr:hypothetical protein [Patescibacteria group bacterium]
MSYFVITGLINAIGSVFFGLYVYLKNPKANLNKTFGLFCLSVAVWSSFYCVWQISTTEESALFWSRALMAGAIFIPVTYLHFILVFLDLHQKKKKFLILSYILSFIFLVLDFTPLFVKNVTAEPSFEYWPKPGIFFHPFLLMFFGYVIYSWYLLFKTHQKITGIKQTQIEYILGSSLIGFLGGSTNYLLWYGIPTPPFWNGLVIIYVLFITYAITKHYLFEIRVILTEILVVATVSTLLIQALLAETLLLKILGIALVGLFTIFGYSLIKSVIKEIELRSKLQKAYAELEKLDKAKTEFLSIASHQLRTPLSTVKGYLSMILEKSYGKIPERIRKPLENVFISNERLVKLVNDLLDISRIETGRMEIRLEKAFLEEIISSVVDELKFEAEEKNIYLKWEKPKIPLPKISIDKDKIRAVILNLIDNAIKYTKRGGATIKCKMENGKIKVEVSDTGVGLEKEEIDMIFKVLTRGKAGIQFWTEGAGLGLYIARKFAEMHQGQIWAESEGKNKGSTFYLELPIK